MPYRPAHTIVKWTLGLFIAGMAIDAVSAMLELIIALNYPDYYDYYTPFQPGEKLIENISIGLMFVLVPVFIATVVLFCVWLFRAGKNARALGAQNMKHSAGMAVGYFFIPIANLFMPFFAAREIEKASNPEAGSTGWEHTAASGILGVWWTLWICHRVLDQISMRMFMNSDPQVAHASSWVGFFSLMFSLGAALSAIRVIRHIQGLQELKVRLQPDGGQRTCLSCGYDLRASMGTHCPECGGAIPGRDDLEFYIEDAEPDQPGDPYA